MDLSLASLLSAVRFTVLNPREGARMVMQTKAPVQARWMALAIMAILSTVLLHLSFGMMPADAQGQIGPTMASPFSTALFQAAIILITTQAVYWIGRKLGGVGTFNDALILMVWLQFILLILQVVLIMVQVLFLPLASVVSLLSVGIFIWLLGNFVTELHKFQSVGKTVFGVLLTMIIMGFVLALVLMPFIDTGVR
jgi:hypothetical protein